MGLIVRNPGVFATIQDSGRSGHRAFGVPNSGPFDIDAHGLANALVGNPRGSATLEMTLVGGEYEADTPLALALAGAPMDAVVVRAGGGRESLCIPQSWTLHAGDRLILGGSPTGARGYLAVRGGWRTPVVLGSRSSETPLRAGDTLPSEPGTIAARRPSFPPSPPENPTSIRVIDGPDAAAVTAWGALSFRLSPLADRMGLRLEGSGPAVVEDAERLSAPVAPGAVQVAGGTVLILGVAGGTMGGYPHVAHVISADLSRLGQFRPGDAIVLRHVALSEARALDFEAKRRRSGRELLIRVAARDAL